MKRFKLRQIQWLLLLLISILPFQNCSQTNLQDALDSENPSTDSSNNDGQNNNDQNQQGNTLDKTAPVIVINNPPASVTGAKSHSFNFVAQDDLSGVDRAECSVDGGAYAICVSPKSLTALADGNHSFKVKAYDKAGNASQESVISWKVDSTAPIITLSSQPNAIVTVKTASFAFSGTDQGVAITNFQCSVDSGAYASCATPKAYTNLGEGKHTFSLRAVDSVGNTSVPISYTWTVDSVAPSVTITSGPSSTMTTADTANFVFTSSDATSGINASQTQCQLDSGAYSSCSSPKSYSGLAAGTHNFRVRVVDNATNSTVSSVHTWTVQAVVTTPPVTGSTNFCPSYAESSIYRTRGQVVVVGPNDDWAGAIQGKTNVEVQLKDGIYFAPSDVAIGNNMTIRSQSGNRDKVIIYGRGYFDGDQELFRLNGINVTIAEISITQARNHLISIKSEAGAQAPHIYGVHLYDSGQQQIKQSSVNLVQNGIIACSKIGYGNGTTESRTFNGQTYNYIKGVKGDYINGIDLHGATNFSIRDNYIYNLWGDGSGCEVDINCGTYDVYGGPAILIWNNASGNVTERNILANTYRGIAYGHGRGHANGIIRNNFIYNTKNGDAGIELKTSTNDQVYNNTVFRTGYSGAIEYTSSSGAKIYNNLITSAPWDRGGNSSIDIKNNINNATVNDIVAQDNPHLKANSRAINAGTPITGLTKDIDGDAITGNPDIGVDEYK